MILYDLIKDARVILIDTNSVVYRWSDVFFTERFSDCVDYLYSNKISLFYDDRGDITKGTYRFSNPTLRLTDIALGDIVHNVDKEMFECTTAGTTGASVPTWDLGYNAETTDGTVVFKNLERNDIPFPDFTKTNLVAYLISKAYEIDGTDVANETLSQTYMQKFGTAGSAGANILK